MAKHTLKILRYEHRKIFKVCLAIYFAQPLYSLLHLQTNISLSWCLFYYIFLRCVIKTTNLILCAYRNYFYQSEVVKCLVVIMSTLCFWFLDVPLIIKKKHYFKYVNSLCFIKRIKTNDNFFFQLNNHRKLLAAMYHWNDDSVSAESYLSNLTFQNRFWRILFHYNVWKAYCITSSCCYTIKYYIHNPLVVHIETKYSENFDPP